MTRTWVSVAAALIADTENKSNDESAERMGSLELGFKKSREVVEEPAEQTPFFKRFFAKFLGLRLVRFKRLDELRREFFVQHVEVGFVVDAHRTVVKIHRSHGRPHIVHYHNLAVIERRFKLVKFNARVEKFAERSP